MAALKDGPVHLAARSEVSPGGRSSRADQRSRRLAAQDAGPSSQLRRFESGRDYKPGRQYGHGRIRELADQRGCSGFGEQRPWQTQPASPLPACPARTSAARPDSSRLGGYLIVRHLMHENRLT